MVSSDDNNPALPLCGCETVFRRGCNHTVYSGLSSFASLFPISLGFFGQRLTPTSRSNGLLVGEVWRRVKVAGKESLLATPQAVIAARHSPCSFQRFQYALAFKRERDLQRTRTSCTWSRNGLGTRDPLSCQQRQNSIGLRKPGDSLSQSLKFFHSLSVKSERLSMGWSSGESMSASNDCFASPREASRPANVAYGPPERDTVRG